MGDWAGLWSRDASTLTLGDYAVILLLLALMVALGLRAGRRGDTARDFFLADRKLPWWAAGLALISAEVSAMTIVGVPAASFQGDWRAAQSFAGSAAARVVVAFLFLPVFHRARCGTAYEFLRQRFGRRTETSASALFVATRVLGASVRLMAAAAVAGSLLGWPALPVIAVMTALAILYMTAGGLKGVAWAAALQTAVLFSAGLSAAAFLLWRVDGGLTGLWRAADDAGKLDIWNFGPSLPSAGGPVGWLADPDLAWAALASGFVGSLAAFGADHEMTQKLLGVRDAREGQKALGLSLLGGGAILLLYLFIGAGLFVFYRLNPGLSMPMQLGRIFPHFAATVMPPFLRGLVVAAVIMASIDLPLVSLAAVYATDIEHPLPRRLLAAGRASVAAFGIVIGGLAGLFLFMGGALSWALKIAAVTYGPLLGAFLAALGEKRPSDAAASAAMGVVAVASLALLAGSQWGMVDLAWTWIVVLGALATWLACLGLGRLRAPA